MKKRNLLPNPAEHLLNAPISVRHWKAILSPAQMARYAFNAYDSLLSLTALQTIQNHDAATAGAYGRERATYDNLRTAMARLYEGSTVDLLLSGGILSVHLCVPGGSLSHWPVQIPKPAGAQLSEAQEEAQEEEGEPEADDLSETGGDAGPFTDEELAGLDPDEDNFNPPNELAYEHYIWWKPVPYPTSGRIAGRIDGRTAEQWLRWSRSYARSLHKDDALDGFYILRDEAPVRLMQLEQLPPALITGSWW